MVDNRECIICKKLYSYCPKCGVDADKPEWMVLFDSEKCKKIYEVCTSFRDSKMKLEDAYDELQKLDLSDIEDFENGTKEMIKDIIKKVELDKSKNKVENNVEDKEQSSNLKNTNYRTTKYNGKKSGK